MNDDDLSPEELAEALAHPLVAAARELEELFRQYGTDTDSDQEGSAS